MKSPLPDTETLSSQPLSYKDTLLGDQNGVNPTDADFLDEEDIDLLDGDVTRGMEDGLVTIDFSDRVHALAVKSLDQTIVIKILGRRIGYTTLRNKLYEIWKPSQAFKLMDIENDYFLVMFRSRTNYLHVLATGPWLIFGYYISVEPWTEDFTTTQPHPSYIITWIRLSGLPVTLYKHSLITELGECIGRVLKLDYQTETGQRGKFARMAIRSILISPSCPRLLSMERSNFQLPLLKLPHAIRNMHLLPRPQCLGLGWLLKKRQRRPQPKEAAGWSNYNSVPITESRFTPILDINTADPPTPTLRVSTNAQASPDLTRPSTLSLPAASKRISKSKSAPPKHASVTLKSKGRSFSDEQHAPTFNVCKPLQLNLADFPILSRNDHRACSSRQTPSPTSISRLDRSNHSSIFLPEKSDPNIQSVDTSTSTPNEVGDLPKKSPDPVISGSPIRDQVQDLIPEDAPKVSLVNWESICQPMERCGLGFRNIYGQNISFMQKLGYLFVTRLRDFWVRLLREKYKVRDLLPISISRASCSPLWRALSNIWESLLSNLAWSLGNGTSVNFFTDIWVPALGLLQGFSQISPTAMRLISFDLVLNEHREWDVMKLSSIFIVDVVPYILGIKSPDPHAETPDPIWKQIWDLQVPQRLRCFLWLTCRQKLMKYLERYKRTLTDDPPCPVCHRDEESILHTLRDCMLFRHIWKNIVPQSLLNTFFSASVKDWLRQNLCSNIMFCNSLPWKLVFTSILWQSWKNRNDVVFAEVTATVEQVISRSVLWANYYNDSLPIYVQVINPASTSTPWKKPESGWLCLNVDGVVSLTTGKAMIGGLLRDNAGNFLFGFSKFIGCANSLHAELWSLHVGLQLAWDYEIEFLQVQTDCKHVIQLLHGSHVESCPISLVRNIRQLWKRA
ncbi:hypothetical protein GQ457_05G024870 [Hibiscus cannabinus]